LQKGREKGRALRALFGVRNGTNERLGDAGRLLFTSDLKGAILPLAFGNGLKSPVKDDT
jgi:hypothetical protein